MIKPTFSILVDTEENTNLAIQQLTQIALEEGIITQEDLEKMDEKKRELIKQQEYNSGLTIVGLFIHMLPLLL